MHFKNRVTLISFLMFATVTSSKYIDTDTNRNTALMTDVTYADDIVTPSPKVGDTCDSETCGPGEVCLPDINATTEKTVSGKIVRGHNGRSGVDIEYIEEQNSENYDSDETITGFCVCDSAHLFNNTLNKCMPKLDFDDMQEKYNMTEILKQQKHYAFLGVSVAGFMFIAIAAVCAISAATFCCKMNISDRKLRDEVEKLSKLKEANREKKSTDASNPKAETSKSTSRLAMIAEAEYVPAVILL